MLSQSFVQELVALEFVVWIPNEILIQKNEVAPEILVRRPFVKTICTR